jgi:DNA repair protein RadC
VGQHSATLLRLVWETYAHCLSERINGKIPVTSARSVVEFAQAKLGYLHYEAFMIIYLNTRNEILAHELVHEGTIDHAHVYPRRVAEAALRKNAAGIILVHNHPSGHPRPSESDTHITRALVKAMRPLDIHILDHIIVSKNGYFSFVEKNLL